MKKNISVTASPHSQHKDITLLSVKGFIDTNTAPEFERTFQTVLGEKKYNLIVDLQETTYISSAGWGIFVGEIKRIRSQKGNLFLAAMSPEVVDAYELLEFDSILKSFPTVDQAVQKGFGKTTTGKGGRSGSMEAGPAKPAAEKSAVTPAAEAVSEKSPANISFVETPAVKPSPKPPFLLRIFMPWKWF